MLSYAHTYTDRRSHCCQNLPSNEFFTVLKVTGTYDFARDPATGDYGHFLPVEVIRRFHKRCGLVDVPLIRALHREQNPIRITYKHNQSLEELAIMQVSQEEAAKPSGFEERINKCRNDLIAQLKNSVNKYL